LQEYRFTIAFMVEPHYEQVEVTEVEGERDEQLPADLQPFQESRSASGGPGWAAQSRTQPGGA
jgi:hypothetical protein